MARITWKTLTPKAKEWISTVWVPALRSGKFAQTEGQLARQSVHGVAFCCLGVLCELKGLHRSQGVDDDFIYEYAGSRDTATLPYQLAVDMGISHDGRFDPPMKNIAASSLMDLNDNAGWSFEQIADFIENELLNDESEYNFIPVAVYSPYGTESNNA